MIEYYPGADESAQSETRNADFHDRLMSLSREAIDEITPDTDPKKVWAVVWALDRLTYDYADVPYGFEADPSTANEIGSALLDLFKNFAGLSHLSEDEVQTIRSEGGDIARRYFQGFPTRTSEIDGGQ